MQYMRFFIKLTFCLLLCEVSWVHLWNQSKVGVCLYEKKWHKNVKVYSTLRKERRCEREMSDCWFSNQGSFYSLLKRKEEGHMNYICGSVFVALPLAFLSTCWWPFLQPWTFFVASSDVSCKLSQWRWGPSHRLCLKKIFFNNERSVYTTEKSLSRQ